MNLHLTIENVTKLAEMIAAKYGIAINDAMLLAEFNLTYAASFQEAASRI